MAIIKIEEYRQKNGDDILKVFCKPTKNFPEGKNFFYAPAEAIDIINNYTWYLQKLGCTDINVVTAHGFNEIFLFHRELCYLYHRCYVSYIDHINHVDTDNTDKNLNSVTAKQNLQNSFSKGYSISKLNKTYTRKFSFTPRIRCDDCNHYPFGSSSKRNEDEACILQSQAEQVWLKEQLGDQYYMFDFMKYRKNDTDLLDLERTGVLSEEEATYQYILRYADNAWYYYRYNLAEYFKDNHIPVPKYSLNENGFMIHPTTNEYLCPSSLRNSLYNNTI